MELQKIDADLSQLPEKFEGHPATRVETGPLEINGDWPGVFLRGDDAMAYSQWLNYAIERLKAQIDNNNNIDLFMIHGLEGLAKLLASSRVQS